MTQTNANEPAPIENAEAIIERFGGIRPMATKINVPVTTVQGWKKRNVIPGARRAEIVAAAQQLNVDISDIMSLKAAAIANTNKPEIPQSIRPEVRPEIRVEPRVETRREIPEAPAAVPFSRVVEQTAPVPPANFEHELARMERRAVTKSTMINLVLTALVVACVALLMMPQQDARLDAIEGQVSNLGQKQSFLSKLMPSNIEERLSSLQAQAERLQGGVNEAIGVAKTVSREVATTTPDNLEQRVKQLESHVTQMTGMPSPNLDQLMAKLQTMTQSVGGQEQLSLAVAQLSAMLQGVPSDDPAMVEQALQSAPAQTPQLSETFADIPPQDVKAAALLLTLTQFRSSLNRDNQPFENDLALLQKLVGTQDPQLTEAIQRLAPYAQEGVLTPSGLSNEFRGLAGDVVVASLQGQDVSIEEKAKARLGDMFQVEKDGELINGTETQNTLAKTDKLLQAGDVEGAITQMQTLDGAAAVVAQPWISKAQATVMAQRFKGMLTQTLTNRSYGGGAAVMPTARGLNIPSQLIQEDSSGINILRPGPSMPE